ncbi:alpha-amylase family glycosyl hydrolase [Gracilibacillus sp. YIM 98692]|uniref:alpha-amylase family glycosyl hydrolase n=1 Tax=Gracilibacillus sp. YIM 98692 TaxID=2663532 RepID=UPI0013D68D8E|nr:alpha-amylase family glycosyl hydrolase [Gracilibacillus sp. YIM 98692]
MKKKVLAGLLTIPLLFSTQTSILAEGKAPIKQDKIVQTENDVFYEILVRSFADSDGDGVGDLRGVAEKLDYIEDLGATAIWLMPITPSPTYHKYDTTDYYSIDPEYGDIEDFQYLVEEADKRGIDVIMDFVVNHTSIEHPWFQQAMDPDSEYRDYYIWADENTDTNEKGPWDQQMWHEAESGDHYLAHFYDTLPSVIPDLNFYNNEVQDEIINAAKHWMDLGVDGFRLDAAPHIYWPGDGVHYDHEANVQWWKKFETELQKVDPDVYLVGEIWQDKEVVASYYEGMESAFNFDLGDAIMESVQTGENHDIAELQEEVLALYNKKREGGATDAVFLNNHDEVRTMTQFEGNEKKAKLAASILMTLSGNPYIYYGEELGMVGDKTSRSNKFGDNPDIYIREPFKWEVEDDEYLTNWMEPIYNTGETAVTVEEQINDPNSMLGHYRDLIEVRKSSKALMNGEIEAVETGNEKVLAYKRVDEEETNLVVHNLSKETVKVSLTLDDMRKVNIVYATDKVKRNHGKKRINLTLPAQSSAILE